MAKTLEADLANLHAKLAAERQKLRDKYPDGIIPDADVHVCPTCNGAEWVVTQGINPDRGIYDQELGPCPDCKADPMARRAFADALTYSGLEPFRSCVFGSIVPIDGQAELYRQGYQYAVTTAPPLCALVGENWTGKTTLAACIANLWFGAGKLVLYREAPKLLEQVLEAKKATWSGPSDIFIMREIERVPCLVIDDLGKEGITQWTKTTLYQVLNERIKAGLPTVITTNISMPEMAKRDTWLHPRLMDTPTSVVLEFTNPPIRR